MKKKHKMSVMLSMLVAGVLISTILFSNYTTKNLSEIDIHAMSMSKYFSSSVMDFK